MSLFDEIRYSFCNMTRHNNTGNNSLTLEKNFDYCYTTVGTQTDKTKPYINIDKAEFKTDLNTGTETQEIESINNNNIHSKCLECEQISRYTEKLERDIHISHHTVTEMQVELDRYEGNLNLLEKMVDEGNERNNVLQAIIRDLEAKIGLTQVVCAKQQDRLDSLTPDCCAYSQTQWGML